MHFDAVSREPGSWREEVAAAARSIAGRTPKPLWLCSNGGITSEAMCRAFYEEGIRIHVLSVVTGSRASAAAADGVQAWCRARSVEHATLSLDAEQFLSHGIEAYADAYVSLDVRAYFRIWLLEKVQDMGGYAIFAESLQYYRADESGPYLLFDSGKIAPLQWCTDHDAAHEPYFFESTPELSLAYAREPEVVQALRSRDILADAREAHRIRRRALHRAWPDMQERRKTSFYEHVMPLKERAEARLRERFAQQNETYRLSAKDFVSELGDAALL